MRRFRNLVILGVFLVLAGCGKKGQEQKPNTNGGNAEGGNKPKIDYQAKFDQLMVELRHQSPGRRLNAISGIVEYREEAISYLIDALKEKGVSTARPYPGHPGSTREAAVMALQRIGPAGEKALVENGLPILVAGLNETDPNVLERTIVAIGLIGPKAKSAAEDISRQFASTNDSLRRAAYDTAAKLKQMPLDAVMPLLMNPEPKVAADAARALANIRPLPKEAIAKLVAHLKADPEKLPMAEEYVLVRNEIADALASFGDQAVEAVPVLIDLVRTTTREQIEKFHVPGRRNDDSPAMTALRRIGQPAIPKLLELLNDPKPFVRAQAARILGGMGPDAKAALEPLRARFEKEVTDEMRDFEAIATNAFAQVQIGGDPAKPVAELAKLLMSTEEMVRVSALRELARFGRKAESVVMAIIPLLDDMSAAVSGQAAETLRSIGPAARVAVPALARKLTDKDLDVRRNTLATIRSFGPIAAEIIPDLTKLLADEDAGFRREAVEVLIAIGPAAKSAVPDLAKLLKNEDDRERMLVLQALAAIGPEAKSAGAAIVPVLQSRDRELRMQALETLGRIGNSSSEVVAAIAARLKDDYQRVRIIAARALALIGPGAKEAIPALKIYAAGNPKFPDPISALWGAVALYRVGDDANENLKKVVAAIRNAEPNGRLARLEAIDAAEYLGTGVKAILPDLLLSLNDNTPIRQGDKTPVRLRAVVAIGKLGAAAKEAVPQISNILKESDPALKRAALDALGDIGPAAAFALPRLREIVRTEPEFAALAQQVIDRIEGK